MGSLTGFTQQLEIIGGSQQLGVHPRLLFNVGVLWTEFCIVLLMLQLIGPPCDVPSGNLRELLKIVQLI